MRQIATLPDEAAQRFADYLLTLEIETRLTPEDDGTAVWVCDEDRVPQARQELEAFQRNPSDTRYRQAAAEADQLRWQKEQLEQDYRERQQRANEQIAALGTGGTRRVTLFLMAVTILVTLFVWMGEERGKALRENLLLSTRVDEWPRLGQVAQGEVWRLVTPIFMHAGWLHLLFNLVMFLSLAGQVESVRGSGRLLVLVLVLAIVSNLGQYYMSPALDSIHLGPPSMAAPGRFYGLSGVVYGLFGYVWVKSRLEPDLGLYLSLQTVVLLLGWFFACLFFISNVANGSHFGGLAAGLVLGALPTRWRRE